MAATDVLVDFGIKVIWAKLLVLNLNAIYCQKQPNGK